MNHFWLGFVIGIAAVVMLSGCVVLWAAACEAGAKAAKEKAS